MPSQWHICHSHLWLAKVTVTSDLEKPFAISRCWQLWELHLGIYHCQEKPLCIFQLPGLKLPRMRWTTACLTVHISGKKYSNWRLNLSLEAKLDQVTTHWLWARKVDKHYCSSNVCVTSMWFVSLRPIFIPSYLFLRCLVSVPRFCGKIIVKENSSIFDICIL